MSAPARAARPASRRASCDIPSLRRLTIAHVDCDAFYATIEKRDEPALADKPLIIGGGKRGVVSTACYIARTFGVRSAMPMFEAKRLCPHATVVRPNMEKYAGVSRQVRALMLELTPQVEPISIDEAFMDLAGTERLHGMSARPRRWRASRARVEREIGITVSIGLASNKFLAKIASDLDKPRGFAVLGRAEAASFLADKPVSLIYGVGRVAAQRLAKDGIRLIADLQRADERELMRRYGAEGQRLGAARPRHRPARRSIRCASARACRRRTPSSATSPRSGRWRSGCGRRPRRFPTG